MVQTPSVEQTSREQQPTSEQDVAKQLMETDSAIAKRVKEIVRTEVDDVSVDMVEFGPVMTLQDDDDGQYYVEDLNGVIRYYIGTGTLVPTAELEESRTVVAQNQHSQTGLRGLLDTS